ncbi:MAG TPA: translocation protein TolB, partial [Myxococcota bacterium]|nr:translocation protein TolB [Myxococcota bacterium]
VLRLDGHSNSEIAGPALDPSGRRLYFSSQRGANGIGIGTTYEVTGPFA